MFSAGVYRWTEKCYENFNRKYLILKFNDWSLFINGLTILDHIQVITKKLWVWNTKVQVPYLQKDLGNETETAV